MSPLNFGSLATPLCSEKALEKLLIRMCSKFTKQIPSDAIYFLYKNACKLQFMIRRLLKNYKTS